MEFFESEEIRDADDAQKAAIRSSVDKNLVILAGAGSGKTRTLVSRLAYLHLVVGIPLSKIVLLTFTRAASEEMQYRAENLIIQAYKKRGIEKKPYVFAKTFDGFFRRIILDYYTEIGFTREPVLALQNNEEQKRSLLKEVINDNQMQGIFPAFFKEPKGIDNLISILEEYAVGLTVNQPGIDSLLLLFLEKQIEENMILGFLYMNLIVKNAIQQENSVLAAILQMKYSCVLIDEFQDVSMLQNETLKSMYHTKMHFTFVGDDDQSIYAWRGADVSIIQDIIHSKDTEVNYLMTNYRNNPNIVKAGNCILRLVDNRAKNGEIIPHKVHGSKIRVTYNDKNYANLVDEIEQLIRLGCKPNEISVLTRKREQAVLITRALLAIGIPVETQESELELGVYYKLMKGIINILSGYNLSASCRTLAQLAKEDNCANDEVYHIVRGDIYCEGGNLALFQRIADYMVNENVTTLAEIVDRYSEKAGEEFMRIIFGNLPDKTIEAFCEYCNDVEAPWPITKNQLTSIYATFEKSNRRYTRIRKMGNGVNVSTIHGAKGLEYDIVMITGLNQGEYPNIGAIDRKYNQKLRELENLRNARMEYYSLKEDMTESKYNALIADCENKCYATEKMQKMSELKTFLQHNKRGILRLTADSIEEYLDIYKNVIQSIEKEFKYDIAKISKELVTLDLLLKQKREEGEILQEESLICEERCKEVRELQERMEIEKEKLRKKEEQAAVFSNAVSNLKAYGNVAYLVSGLLADMEKAEEIENIKKKLEEERQERVAEERRTFYVAVTRARDHLYLFTDKGAVRSEFVQDIDDELMIEYKAMTRTERKDYETIKASLRKQIEKKNIDEEILTDKMKMLINNEAFKNYIAQRKISFYKENPEFERLPQEAKQYFENAISMIFIGEMTGTEFLPEFAHNMQRAMELLLENSAGSNAKIFETEDYQTVRTICNTIRSDASGCITQIPSRKYIEDIIMKNGLNDKMGSLKKAGIMHYIVRSHNFRIGKDVYSTWKEQQLYGNKRQFLKAIIDLSNIRNEYIHNKSNLWPSDTTTDIIDYAKCIVKNCMKAPLNL